MYRLTSEGKKYLDIGLPERRLIELLKKGNVSIDNAKQIPDFAIAMQWAKKNNWVMTNDNLMQLTNEGMEALAETTDIERAMEEIDSVGKTDEDLLNNLISRKLVEEMGAVFEFKEKEIAQLTPQIIEFDVWKKTPFKRYDVNAPAPQMHAGKMHMMTNVIEKVRKIWVEMGFKEMSGPVVESCFWNFDALYQPQDHPARDLADTFYMKYPASARMPAGSVVDKVKSAHEHGWTTGSTGWEYKWDENIAEKLCMRTHSTAVSARTLANLKPEDIPGKYFCVGKVFRNETLTWKNLFEFFQIDGIVVDENVSFNHLLGYLKTFYRKLGFSKIRFRPSYFPYTEMSTEIEIQCNGKWFELGGAGMFRPEVVKPLLGKDIPVLAWGPGLDRLVMLAYGMKDIRQIYENDLNVLRNIKVI